MLSGRLSLMIHSPPFSKPGVDTVALILLKFYVCEYMLSDIMNKSG